VGRVPDGTEVFRHGRKIVVCVGGYHTQEAAVQASQHVAAFVAEINGPVEVICDMTKMTGFMADARFSWQNVLKKVRHNVTLITLVQGTAIARMTAITVGLYAGIKVRSVGTLDEALK
jgi:hypothetical protein